MSERRIATRVVRRLPDETEQYVPAEAARRADLQRDVSAEALQTRCAIDSFSALQLGLWQIFAALRMQSVDLEALLRGVHEWREFQFERIFFDFAKMENDQLPSNSVVLMQQGPTRYGFRGRDTVLLEDTADVYGAGTVLQATHTAEVTLSAVCWMHHKDDRGGVRRAIEDAFSEPFDERPGRRVVIPQYYDQVGRYTLQEIDYPDSAESAAENTWPLAARFLADIPVVKLVARPGVLEGVRPQYRVGDDFDLR